MKLSHNELVRLITENKEQLRRIEDQYKENVKSNKLTLSLLQEKCFHSNTKYHPDASGNNDSWNECLICGKEL